MRHFSGSFCGFHLRLVEFFHSHTVNNSSKRPGPLCLQTAKQYNNTMTKRFQLKKISPLRLASQPISLKTALDCVSRGLSGAKAVGFDRQGVDKTRCSVRHRVRERFPMSHLSLSSVKLPLVQLPVGQSDDDAGRACRTQICSIRAIE